MDVMAELKPIGAVYTAGELQATIEKLKFLWETVPDPKEDTPNAYLIVEYGVALSIKIDDLYQAQEWADRAPRFAIKRHDLGEVEFLVGRVAFERGELDRARSQFLIANAKSEGRIFEAADERYIRLIG